MLTVMTRMFESTGAGERPYVLYSLAINIEIGNICWSENQTESNCSLKKVYPHNVMARKSFYYAQGFYYENIFAEVVSIIHTQGVIFDLDASQIIAGMLLRKRCEKSC